MESNKSKLTLSYNAKLFRLRVSFTKADADLLEQPPKELIENAEARINAVKQSGEIAYVRTYGDRLKAIWSKVREGPSFATSETVFTVSVAAGAPELPGVEVHPPTGPDHLFLLSLPNKPELTRQWRIEWLKIVIGHKAREQNLLGYACQAQIYGSLFAAQNGRPINKLPIRPTATPDTKPDDAKHPYKLLLNRLREEITLHVYDMAYFMNPDNVQRLIKEIKDAAEKASTLEAKILPLDDEVIYNLNAALAGPESLGLDLPFVQLAAASGLAKTGASTRKKAATQVKRGIFPTSPDYGWQIEWDDSAITAKFAFFDPRVYKDSKRPIDKNWLAEQLRAAGIDESTMIQDFAEFDQKVRQRLSLKGVVVAKGQASQAGSGAYLHLNFKDGDGAGKSDNTTIDLRAQQQRSIVLKDQLVAEVRYKNPPVMGRDIFGNESTPPRGEGISVGAGNGIIESGDQFYARFAGLPEIVEGTPITIRLSKSLVHNGDVNLTSGNIIFAGNVEVKGNVEKGALLQVGGDLKIDGSVSGGSIFCAGSVLITGGVTSSGETLIVAKGNIQANFSQNSRLRAGGDINVARGLVASEVVARGSVNVTNNDGMILGGELICGGSVNSPRVGRSDGAITILEVGSNPTPVLRERRMKARQERVKTIQDNDRQALATLEKRKANQLTLHHQNQKKSLRLRIAKAERIANKLKKLLDNATALGGAKYNSTAKLIVSGKIADNCQITIGGVVLPAEERSNVSLSSSDAAPKVAS